MPEFGFSAIANIIASIKLAKYMDLNSDDAIITVATDGADLYMSELNKTINEFKNNYDERYVLNYLEDTYQDYQQIICSSFLK